MSQPAFAPDLWPLADGRQSETAAHVQRGVCRLLRAVGFAALTELPLASGRRADIMAVNERGDIWIIEIKSSITDFRADQKWPEYWDYCDRLYFAIPPTMAPEIMPIEAGLIIADQFGAEIMRDIGDIRLSAARRKAATLRFARAAALRLHNLRDPLSNAAECS
ncbi:MmcB family DNA repair protein [Rhodoligotrophos ferricapiens]|uniref:MmcB family DNA repair protein n=1 Tax=Rhodoligotrophos ferricapiens TaxID=3069264 RepID=UPI00315D05EC